MLIIQALPPNKPGARICTINTAEKFSLSAVLLFVLSFGIEVLFLPGLEFSPQVLFAC